MEEVAEVKVSEILENNSYFLQKSSIDGEKLIFDKQNGFEQALCDGFFLVKIPDELSIEHADIFAKNFYLKKTEGKELLENKYRGYRNITSEELGDPLLGFHQRKYQIEQFLLERRFWKKYYTPELCKVGEDLCQISKIVVCNVFEKIGLPRKYWSKASGGCSNAHGAYHFTFNHFRPNMDTLGLQEHQDDGFITILRSIEPGLEIFNNGKWIKLGAEPNYFKINFGLTMQILTEDMGIPVAAVLHRVTQQSQKEGQHHRWSWGHFSSCHFETQSDNGIYRYNDKDGLVFYSKARDHINKNDSYIYR